jgi:hypothetical protein
MADKPKALQAKVDYFLAKASELRAVSEQIRANAEAGRIRREQESALISTKPTSLRRSRKP